MTITQLPPPQTIQFTFTAVDAARHTWCTQLAVPLEAAQKQNNIAGINNAASECRIGSISLRACHDSVNLCPAIVTVGRVASQTPTFTVTN